MHTRTPHRTHSLQLTTRSVLRVESILFETGDHETITSTLTSGRPAPALSLLAQNTDLIAEILTKRF